MFFKTKKKKGVTLIEVLASLAILALLIIPIANLVINSSTTAKKSQDKQKASLAGQSVLEQIGNIDDSVARSSVYTFDYTNMEGNVVNSGNVQFPTGGGSTTTELTNVGNSRYKIYVKLEREMENKSAADKGIKVETGDDFFSNYNNSALALQLSKQDASNSLVNVYNPMDPAKGTTIDIEHNKYVIYVASDGRCGMYLNNSSDPDNPGLGTEVKGDIGSINNSSSIMRIFLAGTSKLDYSNAVKQGNIPFSGNLNLSVISDYPGISDMEVAVTKGEDASTILSMPAKLGNTVPGSIHVTEYSAANDMNKKLGNLYRVTVEVKPSTVTNPDDTSNDIFSGSTTCNMLNN